MENTQTFTFIFRDLGTLSGIRQPLTVPADRLFIDIIKELISMTRPLLALDQIAVIPQGGHPLSYDQVRISAGQIISLFNTVFFEIWNRTSVNGVNLAVPPGFDGLEMKRDEQVKQFSMEKEKMEMVSPPSPPVPSVSAPPSHPGGAPPPTPPPGGGGIHPGSGPKSLRAGVSDELKELFEKRQSQLDMAGPPKGPPSGPPGGGAPPAGAPPSHPQPPVPEKPSFPRAEVPPTPSPVVAQQDMPTPQPPAEVAITPTSSATPMPKTEAKPSAPAPSPMPSASMDLAKRKRAPAKLDFDEFGMERKSEIMDDFDDEGEIPLDKSDADETSAMDLDMMKKDFAPGGSAMDGVEGLMSPDAPVPPPSDMKKKEKKKKKKDKAKRPMPSMKQGRKRGKGGGRASKMSMMDEEIIFEEEPEPIPQSYSKNLALEYFDRMNPQAYYPLIVDIADVEQATKATVENVLTGERKIQTKEKMEVTLTNPVVTVRPIFPGCVVTPVEIQTDFRDKEDKLTFYITPLVMDEIEGRVDFLSDGKTVHTVQAPVSVDDPRYAKTIAAYGTAASMLPRFLMFFGFNLDEMVGSDYSLPFLTGFLAGMAFTSIIALFGVVIAMVVGLYIYNSRKPSATKRQFSFGGIRAAD